MGEVTPGPPLLQAGSFSSAPGEGTWSLLGALVGADGAGEERIPPLPVEVLCCSTLAGVLESFLASASAGTGMVLYWKAWVEVKKSLVN